MLKATPQRFGPWLVAAAATYKAPRAARSSAPPRPARVDCQAGSDSDGSHNRGPAIPRVSNSTSHGISGTARASMVA